MPLFASLWRSRLKQKVIVWFLWPIIYATLERECISMRLVSFFSAEERDKHGNRKPLIFFGFLEIERCWFFSHWFLLSGVLHCSNRNKVEGLLGHNAQLPIWDCKTPPRCWGVREAVPDNRLRQTDHEVQELRKMPCCYEVLWVYDPRADGTCPGWHTDIWRCKVMKALCTHKLIFDPIPVPKGSCTN